MPAYNVAETIGAVVRGALKYVPLVLVADDGSSDNTAQNAAEAGAEVLTIDRNRGKGHALKVLFNRAMEEGYETVISMDADGQHDPEELPRFIHAHKKHPHHIIVGSRMHAIEKIPRARYNSMHIARFFISFAANQFIEDTQCGFRVYPLTLIKGMRLTQDRYVTESEILIKAGDMGGKIRSITTGAVYGQIQSHFRPILDVAAITAYIISYFLIKYSIEGIFSDKPNTYSRDNLRDRIAGNKMVDTMYKMITVLTFIPIMSVYLFMYKFLSIIIKNNFASVRNLGHGYHKITLAAYLLPVLMIITIFEKLAGFFGVRVRCVDGFIKRIYPCLWGEAAAG
jgi:glycosyltransferase involved in cell wall biosynthesis